ncbi:MAG TPA: pectinesterase family protein, partial [Polyangiaceae bacterium]
AGGTSAGGTSAGGSSAGTGGSSAGAGGTGGGGGNFPANNATGVCLDAPLTLTFTSAPTVGAAGTISIFDSSAPNTAIDTVNVGAGTYTDTIGGQAFNVVRPVFIDGNQAVVYFHQHKLKANTKYFVTVSSGTFLNGQTPVGTVGPNTWSFTTGPAPTAAAAMTVDRTGSGPFCTVQGAFDAIANNNTTARTITVQPGNYHEIVYVAGGKKNITLQGADRAASLIEYPNNNNLNASTSTRNVFYANGTTGMTLSNLTIYNTTPQDGSQAEALRVQADQVILRNANFKSLQDTLDLSGRVYVVGSYIEGNVDFVWGSGAAYFDQCELKTVGRSGAVVQARNGQTAYGYAFVDSKLTAGSGVSNQVLGRIDASQFPYSHVAYINCQMTAIAAKGWTITNPQSPSNLRFWEYQSTDANGKALDTSQRVVQQIDAATAAMMRDKTVVLAGWNPT